MLSKRASSHFGLKMAPSLGAWMSPLKKFYLSKVIVRLLVRDSHNHPISILIVFWWKIDTDTARYSKKCKGTLPEEKTTLCFISRHFCRLHKFTLMFGMLKQSNDAIFTRNSSDIAKKLCNELIILARAMHYSSNVILTGSSWCGRHFKNTKL